MLCVCRIVLLECIACSLGPRLSSPQLSLLLLWECFLYREVIKEEVGEATLHVCRACSCVYSSCRACSCTYRNATACATVLTHDVACFRHIFLRALLLKLYATESLPSFLMNILFLIGKLSSMRLYTPWSTTA